MHKTRDVGVSHGSLQGFKRPWRDAHVCYQVTRRWNAGLLSNVPPGRFCLNPRQWRKAEATGNLFTRSSADAETEHRRDRW